MLAGAAGERGIAGGKKHQVIEIRAVQTEGVFLLIQCYPGSVPELLLAFCASRVSGRDKNDDIIINYYRISILGDERADADSTDDAQRQVRRQVEQQDADFKQRHACVMDGVEPFLG